MNACDLSATWLAIFILSATWFAIFIVEILAPHWTKIKIIPLNSGVGRRHLYSDHECKQWNEHENPYFAFIKMIIFKIFDINYYCITTSNKHIEYISFFFFNSLIDQHYIYLWILQWMNLRNQRKFVARKRNRRKPGRKMRRRAKLHLLKFTSELTNCQLSMNMNYNPLKYSSIFRLKLQ